MIVSVALWVLFPLLICCQSAVHHTHVHVMYTRVLHVCSTVHACEFVSATIAGHLVALAMAHSLTITIVYIVCDAGYRHIILHRFFFEF